MPGTAYFYNCKNALAHHAGLLNTFMEPQKQFSRRYHAMAPAD
jgi:hypothetical protein